MLKKIRTPIPSEIASEILFLSDRTCCICYERGKEVQIHHIDENPSNNSLNNLSALCFDCHNKTMIKGGFGRKLDAAQIKKYNTDWQERIKKFRESAVALASIKSVTENFENIIEDSYSENNLNFDEIDIEDYGTIDLEDYEASEESRTLKRYLNNILIIHKAQHMIAHTKWDTGVTSLMNQGSYEMMAFYEEVLVELSNFYPNGHFYKKNPKKYFNEIISSRFLWHRLVLEPKGSGTGGTMISIITGGNVMEDVKKMIIDMVEALTENILYTNWDIKKWRKEWLLAN